MSLNQRKNDVVLVNPDVGFYLSSCTVKPNIPNAVLCVGTALHHAGYKVKIIDQRADRDWQRKLVSAVESGVMCTGISSMTGNQLKNGLHLARIIRTYSKRPIVWGGIHPTLLPEQTLESDLVDMVVRGEGEKTIVELVAALRGKRGLSGIRGVSYKENGRIYHNPDRPFLDLDQQPPLAYELLEMGNYLNDHHDYVSLDLHTSRGCPFDCSYCYAPVVHHRRWRAMSVDNVIKRVKVLIDRYGVNWFWFDDDNFFTDLERAREIMLALEKLNIRWETRGTRVDTILHMDDEFLDLMPRSGCSRLAVGAESGSNRILRLIRKKIRREDTIVANRKLARTNLYIRYNFMMGFPSETREEVNETISLALRLKEENPRAMYSGFVIFRPYPGCELHDLALQHGLERPASLEEWGEFRFHAQRTAWVPQEMRGMLKILEFTTPFLNDPIGDTNRSLPVRLLSSVYRPLARYRIRKRFFHFPLEMTVAKWLGLYQN